MSHGRKLVVLGAGADVACGIPTVAELLPQLAAFVRADGAAIDAALRKKLPRLRFAFDRYAAGKAENLVTELFSDAEGLVPIWSGVAGKLKKNSEMAPLGVLIENLCAMASSNEISGPSLAELVRLAGGQGSFGDAEPILEPAKLSLSELSASALRKAFQQALVRKQEFSSEELELVEQFVLSVSDIEQLLSTYFTLFPIGHGPDRKTYLYLAWILWAFLWLKSVGRTAPELSIYTQLPRIGADVITFNYTNFFVGGGKRACFFHGQLDRYLRLDDRKLVADDSRLRGIPSVEQLEA